MVEEGSYGEGKFSTAMAMACSFLQVEEIYPDQKKALTGLLKEVIFSSARTKSISDPSPDLNKNTISLQNRKKTNSCWKHLLLLLENNTKVLSND